MEKKNNTKNKTPPKNKKCFILGTVSTMLRFHADGILKSFSNKQNHLKKPTLTEFFENCVLQTVLQFHCSTECIPSDRSSIFCKSVAVVNELLFFWLSHP